MSITEGTVPWPGDLAREYCQAGWWRGRDLGAEIADVAVTRGPRRPPWNTSWWPARTCGITT